MQKYNVDGMHIDDYFYPTTAASFDKSAFDASGFQNVYNYRRYNMNLLVSGIYSATKAIDIDLVFGVSPAGNPSTVINQHCADVGLWCSSTNYIDYIMPQIYWGFEHSICPFAETYQLWANLCCEDVDYMVGLTFANAIYGYNGEYYDEFIENKDIYKKTYEYMNAQDSFDGFSIFCYQYFYNPVTGQPRIETKQELANSLSALKKIPSKKIEY